MTRQSIRLAKRWTRGSSPRMTGRTNLLANAKCVFCGLTSSLRLRLEAARFGARARLAGRRYGRTARGRRLDHGFARWPLAGEQILDLVAGQRLEFEQPLGQRFEIGALLLENALRLGVGGLDQALDLTVDLAARFLRDILLARHLVAQEHLVL